MSELAFYYTIYEHLIANAMIYSIGALSIYFSLRAGVYNLSQAGLMAVGGYISALLTLRAEWPWLAGLVVATVTGAALGGLLAFPVIRLRGHFLAIATLGFGAVIPVLALNLSGLTGGASGLVGIPVTVTPLIALPFLLGTLFVAYRLRRSSTGRAWDAIRLDEAAALASGINLANYKLRALLLSSVTAALAGALFAHANRVLVPSLFGFGLLTDLLVFALLGGLAHPLGPMLGAFFVSTMPEWLSAFNQYREAIIGVLLVLAVVYTPGGLVQIIRTVSRKIRRMTGKVARPADRTRTSPDIEELIKPRRQTEYTTASALKIESLTKTFGGLKALTDVHLDIAPGEIVALIGPNGAGKSTLVNCITGLQSLDAGSISVNGSSVDELRPDERSGLTHLVRTFQTPRMLTDLSVLDNVLVGLHPTAKQSMIKSITSSPRGTEGRALRERALACLDYVGYEGSPDVVAEGLSYGDQRRVELARAIAMEPAVLLLDEPAAGLTESEVRNLSTSIADVAKSGGVGVLLIDHNMSFVMDIAHRVYVLSFGELIAEGEPHEIRKNKDVISVYLGSDPLGEGQASHA